MGSEMCIRDSKKNPLGREIEKLASGWDIQFSSTIDEGTNLAVPQFTVSKKFPNNLEASLNRQEGQQSATELKIKYELNQDVSTVLRLKNSGNTDLVNSLNNLPVEQNQIGVDLEYKKDFK